MENNTELWKEIVYDLRENRKLSFVDIAKETRDMFPNLTEVQVYDKVRRYIRTLREKRIREKKENPIDKNQLIQNREPKIVNNNWRGGERIRFGLIGDTQINSKYTQLTYLHEFYKICEAKGIKKVYHTGDIDEGEQMRVGHQYECYNQGADEHCAEIIKNYPKIDGITTYFITGNHDASIYKRCGVDIGKMIAAARKDMIYLGRDCAVVNLTPNCSMELRHPWDGTAYAASYKPQKIVEAMEADSKPNILAIGHYHKIEYLFTRNIHVFQTGCFQSSTPFTRGKGIKVEMGGWIVDILVDKNGFIHEITPTLIPFYKGIKDDYKNWL